MPGADGGGPSGVARSDATADDGALISGSDEEETEAEPDELDEDEHEIEEIIELVENSRPMQWLVKWKGWAIDREAEWSYVKRNAFTTEGGHQMLLQFERTRKAQATEQAQQAGGKKRARPTSAASSSSSDDPAAAGGRGRKATTAAAGGGARGRGRRAGSPLVPQPPKSGGKKRNVVIDSDEEEADEDLPDYDREILQEEGGMDDE